MRNPLSYQANLQQEADAYANVPAELQNHADQVCNAALNGKTKAGRRSTIDLLKAANPSIAGQLEQHLGPLTGYGQG